MLHANGECKGLRHQELCSVVSAPSPRFPLKRNSAASQARATAVPPEEDPGAIAGVASAGTFGRPDHKEMLCPTKT